jgi:hypothetical protein
VSLRRLPSNSCTLDQVNRMEYQPKKDEIPWYSQHETGWYYLEKDSLQPLAEFDFVEFRRPYFIFKIKLLSSDKLVKDSIYDPLAVYSERAARGFFLKNRASEAVIRNDDFRTTRIGEDTVTLGDRRPGRTMSSFRESRNTLLMLIISVLDLLAFGPLIRYLQERFEKKRTGGSAKQPRDHD